ncbi:MAG: hypothetical protein FWG30_06330 [Eubacteriaceae bacterium]|jgi:hypothetical protein|nr:hypothetical protein [Eubacteriaceae bacterium]
MNIKQDIENEFEGLMKRIRPNMKGSRTFINGKKDTRGLLGPAERKNSWQLR